MKWVLGDGASAKVRAKEEALQSALAIAKNLKKELSEKAKESTHTEAKLRELEDHLKRLEEEKKLIAEDHEHKVTKLIQPQDEEESQ